MPTLVEAARQSRLFLHAHAQAELRRALAAGRLQQHHALDPRAMGTHTGRKRGSSHTFMEHRAYVAGDDLRHVDWRAFARRGRPHVKLYADETRATLELVLDASASMGYVGAIRRDAQEALSKWDAARLLCYALGLLAIKRADAPGLLFWHERPVRALRAAAHAAQGRRLLACLATLMPCGAGHGALCHVPALLMGTPARRRIVVVSDFLRDSTLSVATLRALAERGHEVCAVHLCHADETELPFAGSVQLVDLEGAGATLVDADRVRATFAAQAKRHGTQLQRALQAVNVHYVRHLSDAPLAQAVASVQALGQA